MLSPEWLDKQQKVPDPSVGERPTDPRRLSRENSPNDLFNRYFLDIDVAHLQFIEKGLANRNHPVSFYLQLNSAGFLFDNFAIFAEVLGRTIRGALTLNCDQLEIGKAIQNLTKATVEEDRAMVDDNDTFAEFLDIRHVVAGQKDRSFML